MLLLAKVKGLPVNAFVSVASDLKEDSFAKHWTLNEGALLPRQSTPLTISKMIKEREQGQLN
jgi:hypothetical protein